MKNKVACPNIHETMKYLTRTRREREKMNRHYLQERKQTIEMGENDR